MNKGVNLVATNRAHTQFIPVKISACAQGLDIKRDEVKPLVEANGVLGFLLENGEGADQLLHPGRGVPGPGRGPRRERAARAPGHDANWLNAHEGHTGIRRTFAKLIAYAVLQSRDREGAATLAGTRCILLEPRP